MSKRSVFRFVFGFFISVVVALSAGCASIVSTSQYPVTIKANVDGAMVTIKDKNGEVIDKAVAPTTITLSSSAGYFSPARYTIGFSKDGYLPSSQVLSAGVSGWYVFGNIFFGGLIGWLGVDPATGAMWKLNKQVNGNLVLDPKYQPAQQPTASAVVPVQK